MQLLPNFQLSVPHDTKLFLGLPKCLVEAEKVFLHAFVCFHVAHVYS